MGEDRGTGRGAGVPDAGSLSTPQEFAEALTALRHRSGLSIRKLSSMTGIPSATLGGYFAGRHLPSVSQGTALEDVLGALGVDDAAEVDRWFEAVRRLRARPPDRPPNPFPGLASFTEEQADRFFGREQYVADLEQAVRTALADPDRPGLVALVGASGSGKSSLLRGGLTPRLREHGTVVSALVPGRDPVAALEEVVGAEVVVIDQLEELFAVGVPERSAFLDRLGTLTAWGGDGRRVAVVGVRADFYGQLLREPVLLPALQHAQVLLGPMSEAELRQAIVEPARSAGVSVDEELVERLLRDLAPRGHSSTAAHHPGALPMLSHALMVAWEGREGSRLSLADYLQTGGIAGAVQESAERAYEGLTDQGRDLARNLFGLLVNVDDEGVLTRRRVSHDELAHLAHDHEVEEVLERFISARLLTATDQTVEVSHEALLEAWPRLWQWIDEDREGLRVRRRVSSAAALWAEHGRDDSSLLRGAPLAAALELLSLDHQRGGGLLAPTEREFVELSRSREGEELRREQRRSRRLAQLLAAASVMALVAAGLAILALDSRSQARDQRAAAAQARDEALSRQVAIEADRLVDTDPIVAKQLAVVAHQIAATDKARSSLLDTTSARDATRFVGPEGSMHASATADGSLLALAGADGRVRLWQRGEDGSYGQAAEVTADPEGGLLFAGAISPDERLLAVGGIAGSVTVFDISDPGSPGLLTTLDEPESAVQSLAFSRDGRTLAAATSDPALHRWQLDGDAVRPLPVLRAFATSVQAVAFAPGGVMATATNGGAVALWRAGSSGEPRLLHETQVGDGTTSVLSVAFSPDGRTLAAGAKDKLVRLWDVTVPTRPRELDGPETQLASFVHSVTFSADGARLAAGGSDGSARVWELPGGAEIDRVPVPANVTSVAFVDGDRGLLTGSLDGTARLWSLLLPGVQEPSDNVWSLGYDEAGSRLVAGPGTADGAIHVYDVASSGEHVERAALRAPASAGTFDGSAAIAPSGDLVAGGTATGHVVLWRDTGERFEQVVALAASTELIEVVAFGDDGRLLAGAGDDGAVVVWDVAALLAGQDAEVARVDVGTVPLGMALSPAGSLLAVGAADNLVHLWRLDETGAVAEELESLAGFENYANGVAFSADGRLLAAGSSAAAVRIWDVSDPTTVEPVGGPVLGPTETVYSVAWHPSGDVLAGASTDGTVWLWDMADPARPDRLASLTGLGADAYVVTFTPDGSRVLAGGAGGAVTSWSTSPGRAREQVCATTGTRISEAEWSRYVEGLRPFDYCG